ncbi:MAG: uncharacterized protein QOD66_3488 [Solirubrobacteraceae bacterium]|nr:uncharacterized protein [Solirubrobacteraceae bacterium]
MVALASLTGDDVDGEGRGARDPRVRVVAKTGEVVCTHCEVEEGMFGRMRGLLGRGGLEPGGGMLLAPAPSVMTFFMRFSIDVVFLDREHRIVGISHTMRPWRVAGARHAFAALELPAGTAAACGLRKGDVLEIGAPASSD